jgi:4-amino-4-deoxy-L-arabinose transferase-like glycosyltransferase
MEARADGGGTVAGRYLLLSVALILLHAFFMLYRYGQLPIAPAIPDEVIINDAAVSLARGHGYVATSLTDSKYGLDHMFAHFPPLYPYTEAVAFRLFGVSAYTLRLTTTLMSIGTTVVLFFLLRRLCAAGWMGRDLALLLLGLYCTCVSLVALERMARMESMIGLLLMLALWAVLHAATQPAGRPVWVPMLAAGLCAAMCVAVHPEAMTALLLVGPLLLFVVPARTTVRLVSVGLFLVVPLGVGLAAFGSRLPAAVHQFLSIAHDSAMTNPTSEQWLVDALHNHDLSRVNRNVLLVTIMLLMALAPVIYLAAVRRLPKSSLRYRFGACMAVVGVLEILLMVFVLRMDDRRCQFLFGPLLVCDALCLLGAAPLRRWQGRLGWAVVVLQCCGGAFYLYPRKDRVADMNPDRYRALVEHLPAGLSVATTPGLWLDLEEAGRPFTLILHGLDGQTLWSEGARNPLDRFDVVVLEDYYIDGRPWLPAEAQAGRTKQTLRVGRDVVNIYVRESVAARR